MVAFRFFFFFFFFVLFFFYLCLCTFCLVLSALPLGVNGGCIMTVGLYYVTVACRGHLYYFHELGGQCLRGQSMGPLSCGIIVI